jgi:two-component system, LytTR family, response regulator AlgR
MSGGPLRVLIVDDEAPARSRIRDLLSDCAGDDIAVVGEAATGRAALDLLADTPADVVLLDIRMPEMDGLELAQHLRRLNPAPAVIFTSAYDQYAIRAFEVHAVDYLLKPIRLARLQEALARARSARPIPWEALEAARARRPRAFLSAQERGRITLIPIAEVLFFRAELKYVTARTAERDHLLEESLVRLEQEYAERFVRVHRSCLVAKAAIRGFERVAGEGTEARWCVVLGGSDERIPVSRRQHHIIRVLGRGGSWGARAAAPRNARRGNAP